MFELNKNLELNLLNYFKEFAENYLNEIMYYEREEFLKKEKDNRASGYNKRNLKLSFELSLELKVPKVRKNAKHLNFSVFEKYKRNSFIFDKKLFDLYSSRMFEKEICKLLDISSINYKKKKEIKKKYLEKYNKFMLKYIESFDILKLDATEFGKKKNKYIHTVYFIWGLKKENGKTIKKCLSFIVGSGKEIKKGWEIILNNFKLRCDLSKIKLIVTDMNNGLKKYLETDKDYCKIKKQNCLWHRLDSLSCRIRGLNTKERQDLKYTLYEEIRNCNSVNELKEVLDIFKNFNYVKLNRSDYTIQKDIEKMLSYYYEDNFSYLLDKSLLIKYDKKELFQNMDIESLNSQLKRYLYKYYVFKDIETLTFKTYTFLERNDYI